MKTGYFPTNPIVEMLYVRAHNDTTPACYFDGKHARLLEDFTYIDLKGREHKAEKGLITDGGTVKVFLHLTSTPFREFLPAYLIHDWYCDQAYDIGGAGGKTLRKEADVLFLEMLDVLGASWALRRLMYRGVRVGSLKISE